MDVPHIPGVHPVAIPRPQVGIERLPTRRMSNEPRESTNCKSCRKRKIKCNRLRSSCEACQVFQCPCIYGKSPLHHTICVLSFRFSQYRRAGPDPAAKANSGADAVPKKRGPKADVLEALLKRVDALEAKLREKGEDDVSLANSNLPGTGEEEASENGSQVSEVGESTTKRATVDARASPGDTASLSPHTPIARDLSLPPAQAEVLLDTYFARHTTDPCGYQAAANLSEDLAARARREINTDEPFLDSLQALLLLVSAFTATEKGKKAYMLMTSATGMAMALEIHKETDGQARMTPVEREMRRPLFWTCYLLDWFQATGSNLQYFQGSDKKPQGSMGMLIDITRVLGNTNRNLAAGGVKGDSHFPWHTLSTISKIRQVLDVSASGTKEVFSNLGTLLGQADSTILLLSKVIHHLIHCLIYRPFLSIDLAELAETGQHQSWQIEATNMCFLRANAIMELIQLGKQSGIVDWPAFIGYFVCTAATVHVHGAHYSQQWNQGECNVFSSAAEFLSREMQFLSELRFDAANLRLADVVVDMGAGPAAEDTLRDNDGLQRPSLKRKNTASPGPFNRRRPDVKVISSLAPSVLGLPTPGTARRSFSYTSGGMPHSSPGLLATPTSIPAHHEDQEMYAMHDHMGGDASASNAAVAAAAVTGFTMSPTSHTVSSHNMSPMSGANFRMPHNCVSVSKITNAGQGMINEASGGCDTMLEPAITNDFGSPAAWRDDDSYTWMPFSQIRPVAANSGA
ncbi:hypothetical protein Focb16_v005905 [Fusarium oxysporum f. sp. cubense]|uniref:Zn(2)-C6 fungal-type domain-containing protein n=1 Tax=Fusarium oxysporum f. sp. cubense TaxID=61366 RepID=A0A559LK12_FUSOC|nr:hypothetical protein Focb16_v005905 [Fusarium oxysporum f. sp. cubense]